MPLHPIHSCIVLSLLLVGCQGDSDLVEAVLLEDACGVDGYGYDSPSEDAIAALERTACYRNLMGLAPPVLDERLDAAAQAHADYMQTNQTLTHQQNAGSTGFTGEWAWDRASEAGYGCNGCSYGEVLAMGVGPAAAVDIWMDSVYHRVPFTQHGWTAGGFGLAGLYTAMTIVSPFPDVVDKAIVYPVNGQLDVPVDFDSDTEWPDPAPGHGLVGYPVTVTVASTGYASLNGVNPFDIQVESATLVGPDGDVEHLLIEPSNDNHVYYTVCLLPTAPLAADATYEADICVSWTGDQQRCVSSVFTTIAAEG